jgi:peptidylprolyl isomerase
MQRKSCTVLLGILLIGIILGTACAGKEGVLMAKDGDNVKVHYTGTLEDGSTFDSSKGNEPLEFTVGEGKLIQGFEDAVRGMQVGQTKTVTIPAEDAYGPHRDDLFLAVERSQMPEGLNPEVGQQLQMRQANDVTMVVTVADVSDTTVTIDANHPLAGKDLTFEIELVAIN